MQDFRNSAQLSNSMHSLSEEVMGFKEDNTLKVKINEESKVENTMLPFLYEILMAGITNNLNLGLV